MSATSRTPRRAAAVLAATLLVLPTAHVAHAGPEGPALARAATRAVGVDAVHRHLIAFQRIADRNGGHRAPGSPGYLASADYVADKLTAAGFTVTRQEFPVSYSEPTAEHLVVGGERIDVNYMLFTPNTPVGGITGPLAVVADEATPGCEAADFADADYTGAIVLVRRGVCSFAVKQQNAAAAGAAATLIYNNADSWLRGSLGSDAAARIPTGGLSEADGRALRSRAGQPVSLDLRRFAEERTSVNLVAQTATGRADNVVVAGAYLDSVVEGPGISGNGTGAAALLETALALGSRPKAANAVRFVWWGSWEFGQLGSRHYVERLTFEQQLDIALYLNFDTLAAPNAGYFVYDGDNSTGQGPAPGPHGSAHIERTLVDYLASVGVRAQGEAQDPVSDQRWFTAAGIPSGTLFTGNQKRKTAAQAAEWGGTAGAPFDTCYHEGCDDLGNVGRTALGRNAKAVAWAVASYAASTGGVNGVPSRAQRAVTRSAAPQASAVAADLSTR
ncbi:M28 family peptidase [Actinosynnema sp. NPDC023794]